MSGEHQGKGKSPFFIFKSWAFHVDGELSMKARSAGAVLADHMSKGKFECFVGLPRLGQLSGQSERSAWASVRELERAGMFSVQSGGREGSRRSNTYTLLKRDPRKDCKGGAQCRCGIKAFDPRKACKGQPKTTLAKSVEKTPRPSQNPSPTLAKFASEPLLNLYTDEPLRKTASEDLQRIRRIEGIEERLGRIA